jgi:hypothetical protein
MTKCRNVLIAALADRARLVGSASALLSFGRKRAAARSFAALTAAVGLMVALGVESAGAAPPDECWRNMSDGGQIINEVKGSEIKGFTVCRWTKRYENGFPVSDFTYTGTIEDTRADGARARLRGGTNSDCARIGPSDHKSGRVLMEAVGKGAERNFGRAAGGGIVRRAYGLCMRLETYDKSAGKVQDSSDWLIFD